MQLTSLMRHLPAATLAVLVALACEPKDGGGSGTNDSSTTAPGSTSGGSTGPQECTPGDMKSGEGDCQTCVCSDAGTWQCSLCDPTTGPATTDAMTDTTTSTGGTTGDGSTGGTSTTGSTGGTSTTGGPDNTTADTGGGAALPNCFDLGEGDMFVIDAAKIVGDDLVLDVGYGGGCKDHEFTLCFNAIVLDTNIIELGVHHDAHGDACEAFITEQRTLDLTPLQQLGSSPIEIALIGWNGLLEYVF